MITPTVGRVVWFWAHGNTQKDAGEQPMSAQIAFVHNDRLINIGYFDHHGVAHNATSIALIQDGDALPTFGFCEWMPYQKGQAAKTDALEAAAKGPPRPTTPPTHTPIG